MIHEIGVELGAELAAQGCPLKVVDGKESTNTTTFARERIVIQYDPDGDHFTNTRSQHKNPKIRMTRNIGVLITIYAQAVNAGATDWEHKRRSDHVLDLVLVALEKVLIARLNGFVITKGRFILPADLAQSETIGGAVYELKLSIERGVYAQKWSGAIAQESALSAVASASNVTLSGGSPLTPETNC